MLIRAYSDLHGRLPVIAPCDVLLIAGDVCPIDDWPHSVDAQTKWLNEQFATWLGQVPAERILMTPGNHDFALEAQREWPQIPAEILIDQSVEIDGLKIHASPWVPALKDWAFYADEVRLRELADAMPSDAQLWMQHGPPYGILDMLWKNQIHVGNAHLGGAIIREKPQWYICGHIHEGFGIEKLGDTQIANVSFVDEFYESKFRHLALRWDGRQLLRSEADETNVPELWTASA